MSAFVTDKDKRRMSRQAESVITVSFLFIHTAAFVGFKTIRVETVLICNIYTY